MTRTGNIRSGTLRRATTSIVGVVVALAALLAFGLATPPPAGAAGGTFTIEKAGGTETLSSLQGEARDVRMQMSALNEQLRDLGERYDAARERFEASGRRLSETRFRLTRTQLQLDAQRDLVAARIVAIYKSDAVTVFDLLFGSQSFAELQSDAELFAHVAAQDRNAEETLARLSEEAQELVRELEEERGQADAAQDEIAEQRAEIADRHAQRRAILRDLTARINDILLAGLPAELTQPRRGSYVPLTWARAFVQDLQMPATAANLAAVTAWELAEGGHWHNSARFNPLNTTQPMPGATSMNSVGVKAYASWAQGFAATVKTIRNGYYDGILAALRAGDDAQAVADAVAASPWGTNDFRVTQ